MKSDEATPRLARALKPFQSFAKAGSLSGIILIVVSIVALAWANSPFGASYFALWETVITIGPESAPLSQSLHHWINDGLMAVFFLLVGLEIKRELLLGELASWRQAMLPIAAALGGMLVPAVIYVTFNAGTDGAQGWGIPMATDIAFALGVLALLGPRVPVSLKVFLTAVAIVDDMGAVVVIAAFYSHGIAWTAAAAALAVTAILILLNRMRVIAILPYLVLGFLLWIAMLSSGLHATIAGVILAFTIPAKTRINAEEYSERARGLLDDFDRTETGDLLVITSKGQQEAIHQLSVAGNAVQGPLLRLEHALNAPVSYLIVPLFALANAGVRIDTVGAVLGNPVTFGVALGLLFGKPLGITLFAWLAARMTGATTQAGVAIRDIYAVSWLGGMGFTMSLFVAGLAFGESGSASIAAKVGILAGSGVSGAIGFLLLSRRFPRAGSSSA